MTQQQDAGALQVIRRTTPVIVRSPGPQGIQGNVGDVGPPNVLHIGTVTTIDPDEDATVSIAGTSPAQTLSFGIPQGVTGDTGPANTLDIGTVTTGAPGSDASAEITGTAPNQTLSLEIPRGDVGPQGDKGDKGDKGDTGDRGPAGTPTVFALLLGD